MLIPIHKLASSGVLTLVLGAGCMVHRPPPHVEPPVPAAASFHELPSSNQVAFATSMGRWWESFHDPALDGLMGEAFEGNLELRQLAARLEQAQALARQEGSRLFPTLDATGDYEVQWIEDLDGNNPQASRQESSSLGGLLQWEIDIWGKLRSAKRAQEIQTEVAAHELRGGRLLLSAALAETYFQILEQRQQLALLREQIDVNVTLLDLTRLRFGQGQSSIVDVLQQREQLAATRTLIPDIQARLDQHQYSLDVLVGRAPGERPRSTAAALLPLPPPPAVGLPSALLHHRPDVRAARDLVTALDYRVGEAVADRLPRFVLGGSLLAGGDPGLTELITSAFASAVGPVFDAGVRRAEVDLRRAEVQEALAAFARTYLEAVQEVESSLSRERNQIEHVGLLEEELQIAEHLLVETRHRYSQGLTDYLPVLDAVVRKQNLERELITSRRELLSARVALHRALGGPTEVQPANLARRTTP